MTTEGKYTVSIQEKKQVAKIIQEIVALNGLCNKEDEIRINKMIDSIIGSVNRHFSENCANSTGEPILAQLASGEYDAAYDFIWNFHNNKPDSWINNADFVADFIQSDNAGKRWLEINKELLE